MIRALERIRVLDLADESGVFASRILADLGADVVRVEPPDGGRVRQRAPFLGGVRDPERSFYHLYHNANKRSVSLDWQRDGGVPLLRRLLATSDVLIETAAPGSLDARGLSHAELIALRPDLVQVSITPFGLRGPWSRRKANDLVAAAAGGLLFVSGSREDAPAQAGGDQSYKLAGLAAAAGAMIALHARGPDGRRPPVHLDVSIQEAVALSTVQTSNPNYCAWHGTVPGRPGLTAVHRCADGHWITVMLRRDRAAAFLEWLREAGLAPDDTDHEVSGGGVRLAGHRDVRRLAERCTREEFLRRAWQIGILALPVQTLPDLERCAHFAATGQFREVKHEPLRESLGFPCSPVECVAGGAELRRAPLLGEHDAQIHAELGLGAEQLGALRAAGVIA